LLQRLELTTSIFALIHYWNVTAESAVPALPIQAVLRKFCHNKEYSNARYANTRVKHPALVMNRGAHQFPVTGPTSFAQVPYSYGESPTGVSMMSNGRTHHQMPLQPANHQMGSYSGGPAGFVTDGFPPVPAFDKYQTRERAGPPQQPMARKSQPPNYSFAGGLNSAGYAPQLNHVNNMAQASLSSASLYSANNYFVHPHQPHDMSNFAPGSILDGQSQYSFGNRKATY
jgi:hypothetical protein